MSHSFMILDVSETKQDSSPCTAYPVKEYEIWSSAFTDQGMEGHWATPTLLGKAIGRTFQDACMRFWLHSELNSRITADRENKYYDPKRWDYNPYQNTYWALRHFETKEEAWAEFKTMVTENAYNIYYKNEYNKP